MIAALRIRALTWLARLAFKAGGRLQAWGMRLTDAARAVTLRAGGGGATGRLAPAPEKRQ